MKSVKDAIVDLKKNLNKGKLDKRDPLRAHEDEYNSLQYQFHKYDKNKHSANINGYLAYKKLNHFNTKIWKISDKLENMYEITLVTNHLQCAEPSDTIIKCAYLNRRPIQNCTSIYQMKLCTISSALFISRRPCAFIRGIYLVIRLFIYHAINVN